MAALKLSGGEKSYFYPRTSLFSNVCLSAVALYWLSSVNKTVKYPYLDEVFHIRQAQTYCRDDFTQWDPKITTPPGLYLISWFLHKISGDCCTSRLRGLGWVFLSYFMYKCILACRVKLQHETIEPRQLTISDERSIQALLRDVHTAVNICLFPPLFFVSALYYTDVASTFFVVLSYRISLLWSNGALGLFRNAVTIMLGLFALLFRQTNIFWVAIFPAGLALVDEVKIVGSRSSEPESSANQPWKWKRVVISAWNEQEVYDPPVNAAFIDDYFKAATSIAISAIRHPVDVFRRVQSYLAILLAFGAFVYWNGGVVLGDKSNHIATLHLPQMLYIWPYILFFSFPIAFPHLISPLLPLLPHTLRPYTSLLGGPIPGTTTGLPRLATFAALLLITLPVIHYNTIVHPFTLADNRHYTFYVFRRLLAHPSRKYLAAPLYLAAAWTAIQTLAAPVLAYTSRARPPRTVHDIAASTAPAAAAAAVTATAAGAGAGARARAGAGASVSFVLVWLAATALGLISAPLVEPRYGIVPWIMWRLHVPDVVVADLPGRQAGEAVESEEREEKEEQKSEESEEGKMPAPVKGRIEPGVPTQMAGKGARAWLGWHGDHRLWLETAWLLLINGVTGYVFLYRGFEWPQEPGQVQRFMW